MGSTCRMCRVRSRRDKPSRIWAYISDETKISIYLFITKIIHIVQNSLIANIKTNKSKPVEKKLTSEQYPFSIKTSKYVLKNYTDTTIIHKKI